MPVCFERLEGKSLYLYLPGRGSLGPLQRTYECHIIGVVDNKCHCILCASAKQLGLVGRDSGVRHFFVAAVNTSSLVQANQAIQSYQLNAAVKLRAAYITDIYPAALQVYMQFAREE